MKGRYVRTGPGNKDIKYRDIQWTRIQRIETQKDRDMKDTKGTKSTGEEIHEGQGHKGL